ncbi:MAG: glycosyltransferase family 39 protein [Terricaulis sp.]
MTDARGIDRPTLAFWAVLIGLTALRIYVLRLDLIDLYFDEAQYWAWSRSFEFGYFTKPPLVAWVIGATTAVFGDSEWAVRLAAPLAHAVAALALFGIGRAMYGAWAGFWAGLGWLLIPGVTLSATIMSTDALLLPLWALALLSLWRLTLTRSWWWAILLGAAMGLGVQAKYAMLYFPVCAALAAYWLAPVRQGLAGGRGIVAALLAVAIMAPNLYWNFENGFVTAQHTVANARFDAPSLFNFDELLEFVVGQAGVIGPLLYVAFAVLLWFAATQAAALRQEDKFLLSFILPPLIAVAVIAFVSRANANWAAVAYPAAVAWISGKLASGVSGRRFLAGATLFNAAVFAAAAAVVVYYPAIANRSDGIREASAWEETANEIARRAAAQPGGLPFTAVLVDDRTTFFELNYYWREHRNAGAPLPPIRMWLLHAKPRNSAELTDPMRPVDGARVLVVHMTPEYVPLVAADFERFRPVERLAIPLGGDVSRKLEISVGEGFAPAARDAAFEERLHGQRD